MRSQNRILALALALAPLSLAMWSSSARADLYTLDVSNGGTGNSALDATATFNVTAGQIVITLTNNLSTGITNLSAGEAISGINFTLGSTSGPVSYNSTGSSVAGQLATITGANNLVTYVTGDPVRWLGQGPHAPNGHGTVPSVSGTTVSVLALGGGQPSQLIVPDFLNNTSYSNVNNLGNFSPGVIHTLTLTLNLSGVAANTTVTGATVYFGTGPDSHLSGTPTVQNTPEPSTSILVLTALAPLGVVRLIRRRGQQGLSQA